MTGETRAGVSHTATHWCAATFAYGCLGTADVVVVAKWVPFSSNAGVVS